MCVRERVYIIKKEKEKNMLNKKIIVLTGISWSWKTTLQQFLLQKWWNSPYNYTTRPPRNGKEKDEYIFPSEKQFIKMLKKWHFIEWAYQYETFYWISVNKDKTVLVLTPEWREQVRKLTNWKAFFFFLSLPKEKQKERLLKRGDDEDIIDKRIDDSKWMSPAVWDVVLDATKEVEDLADEIEKIVWV